MYERTPPRYAAEIPEQIPQRLPQERPRRQAPKASLGGSPDRIALWAVVMAVAAMFAAIASSADGADGGIGVPSEDKKDVAVKGSTSRDIATWYGPGLYGNNTACGQTLKRRTVGVAHKRLPCGTRVSFRYGGRMITTKVIDRGPYAHNAVWDLTSRAAKQLDFRDTGIDVVRATVAK